MHGKKREEYKAKTRDPKTAAILAKKAEQWYILTKELQGRRQQQQQNDRSSSHERDFETTLKLLGKALEVNPDPSNLWNHRREVILRELERDKDELSPSSSSSSYVVANANETNREPAKDGFPMTNTKSSPEAATGAAVATTILQRERVLTQRALERNPKAYGAWFHRKWILQKLRPSLGVLQEELALTKQFLSVDERNFHCWNYRRFVVACLSGSWDGEWTIALVNKPTTTLTPPTTLSTTTLMGTQAVTSNNNDHGNITTTQEEEKNIALIPIELIQSEFDFTTEKIQQNFSNFSAFHYRSQLLDLCHCKSGSDNANGEDENENDTDRSTVLERIMEEEFQLIEDAVCTEPDDQTCWWYHAILLDKLLLATSNNENINSNDGNGDGDGSGDNFLFSAFRPRLQEQAELFREILEDSPDCKWVILGLFRVLKMLGTTNSEKEREENDEAGDEQEQLLQRLMEIDPYRSKRYEELRVKIE